MINNYDIAVLSEKVAYLEAAIKNAGIELPEVTTDDNGKTLQVVAGKWDKGNKIPGVVNVLDSTSTTDALSAAQGKALNDLFNDVITVNGNSDYITQEGAKSIYYVKIGRIVIVSGRFNIATEKPAGQSNYLFINLPAPLSLVSVNESSRDDLILTDSDDVGVLTSNSVVGTGNYNIFCAYVSKS